MTEHDITDILSWMARIDRRLDNLETQVEIIRAMCATRGAAAAAAGTAIRCTPTPPPSEGNW